MDLLQKCNENETDDHGNKINNKESTKTKYFKFF